jgi:hypothetical protein
LVQAATCISRGNPHVWNPLPTIRPRPDGTGRRYVNLFEGSNVMLPIKRVIVGPSPLQAEHAAEARNRVGSERVTLSQTRPPELLNTG